MVGGLEHPELQRIRGLEATAEEGDLDATYVLGLIATNGSEVSEPDERKARELQAWASWHGHIDATFEYSLLLRQGIGGPRDTVTADRLERVAAEAGHPRACLNVGARVHAERGDCEEVAGWYERASLGGSKEAALRLVQIEDLAMNVRVEWMEWDAAEMVQLMMREKVMTMPPPDVNVDPQKIKEELEKEVREELETRLQSMRSQNLKRVKNVHYNVTYNPKDGKPKPADYVESTNEWDKWLR